MANITGRITINSTAIMEFDANPNLAGGTVGDIGDFGVDTVAGIFYVKTSAPDTGWTQTEFKNLFPTITTSINYLANGNINFIEFFKSVTQITANRISRSDFTYNSDLSVATEVCREYANDGTTVLFTTTYTFTYTNGDLTSYSRVVT